MNKAFTVHMLNDQGKAKATKLAEAFDTLLASVEGINGPLSGIAGGPSSREAALIVTHLELASFYAKKAMAQQQDNQQP